MRETGGGGEEGGGRGGKRGRERVEGRTGEEEQEGGWRERDDRVADKEERERERQKGRKKRQRKRRRGNEREGEVKWDEGRRGEWRKDLEDCREAVLLPGLVRLGITTSHVQITVAEGQGQAGGP